MRSFALLFLCLSLMAAATRGARILGLLSLASPSHYLWNRALMLELARRGHQVTVFSPDAEKQPVANYTNLVVDGVYEALGQDFDYIDMKRIGKLQTVLYLYEWGRYVCERTLKSSAARRLLQMAREEPFDLIVVEITLAECAYGFIDKLGNPPTVGVTAYGLPPWVHRMFGNPVNPSYVNLYDLPYTDRMTFPQRLANALYYWYVILLRDHFYLPKIEAMNREFFGADVPTVQELEQRISLGMVNSHVVLNFPQPHVPAVVPVGGLQVQAPKPLPKDLKTYLDSSTNGVVYFNLGTNVKSSKLGAEVQKMLVEAFSELEQNVLWKFETEDLKELPKNVKISKWLPQTDILAHPNVRVFVSHGGLLSTHEALHRGVPVIIMPFFADQDSNLASLKARGAALELDYLKLTKEDVVRTIKEAINNPSYKENMKKLSAIFKDEPETPLERAVYWTEYVLKHGGAPHLRSASLDLAWYQLLLIDVIEALLLAVGVVLVLSYFVIKKILALVFGSGQTKQKLKRN